LLRLLLACGLAVAIGACATAIAVALGSGPTPPPKPLAQAVHDALAAPPVQGVSATIHLTDHLLEGANIAASAGDEAGGLTSNPLLAGGSGRLWISPDGRVRLELQAEGGDTQVLYDGHEVTVYDAASNTLYRLAAHRTNSTGGAGSDDRDTEAPSVGRIEQALSRLSRHAVISGATPDDVAGRAAYTVRIAPTQTGSLLAGAELSFDAANGVPLRAAVYSTAGSSPVLELAASDVSYGPIDDSVFHFTPPASAKVEEVRLPAHQAHAPSDGASPPKVTAHGHGPGTIFVVEQKVTPGSASRPAPEDVPKVDIDGATASELSTELGTLLSFERSGVRYVVGGSATQTAVEALARGL
jgi:outer membrane lipoprotein-sorting protein